MDCQHKTMSRRVFLTLFLGFFAFFVDPEQSQREEFAIQEIVMKDGWILKPSDLQT
jgi:hypothetical protein